MVHGNRKILNVDVGELRSTCLGVLELSRAIEEMRAHVEAMSTPLPMGSSPQAHALSQKFNDRAAEFRELLHTMELQLAAIAHELDSTSDTYREIDSKNLSDFLKQ
ncbi:MULTISPECIES: WXG100 family type VII secretion target [Actinosynnema]|uniref:WXG100 family type VII secretion target n=1 Tax=Actinosynnema TaxID=40566 RepID=UPI0020A29F16|nr:hypothetical protein [Actinosynnema pretiosum]MCP2092262.1 hypothetical protein [Actinosynnema pretiosum]